MHCQKSCIYTLLFINNDFHFESTKCYNSIDKNRVFTQKLIMED